MFNLYIQLSVPISVLFVTCACVGARYCLAHSLEKENTALKCPSLFSILHLLSHLFVHAVYASILLRRLRSNCQLRYRCQLNNSDRGAGTSGFSADTIVDYGIFISALKYRPSVLKLCVSRRDRGPSCKSAAVVAS